MLIGVKTWLRAAFIVAAVPLFAACASGPTYDALHASEPAVSAESARIYFYRLSTMVGSAIQPSVKIDGVAVGSAKPGGYFYVDRPAGTYEVSTTTETKESISVAIKSGEVRYVRLDIQMGLLVGHVAPSLIWPDQAIAEIKGCHYIGDPQKP
ncbi:MAG: DUF2846 domain-containing protein [Rhizomicrobium sp.]